MSLPFILSTQGLPWYDDTELPSDLVSYKRAALAGIPLAPTLVVTPSALEAFVSHHRLVDLIERHGTISSDYLSSLPLPNQLQHDLVQNYDRVIDSHHWQRLEPVGISSPSDLGSIPFFKGENGFIHYLKKAWLADLTTVISQNQSWDQALARHYFLRSLPQPEISGELLPLLSAGADHNTAQVQAMRGFFHPSIHPDRYLLNWRDESFTQQARGNQEGLFLFDRYGRLQHKRLHQSQGDVVDKGVLTQLAQVTKKLQRQTFFPQSFSWGLRKGQLWVQQLLGNKQATSPTQATTLKSTSAFPSILSLAKGTGVSGGIVSGRVRLVKRAHDWYKVKPDEIVVTALPLPNLNHWRKPFRGIILEHTSLPARFSLLLRELHYPCVIGVKQASRIIRDGQAITLNGQTGIIYHGALTTNTSATFPHATQLKNAPDSPQSASSSWLDKLLKPSASKDLIHYYPLVSDFNQRAHLDSKESTEPLFIDAGAHLLKHLGVHPQRLITDGHGQATVSFMAQSLLSMGSGSQPLVYALSELDPEEYRQLKYGYLYEPHDERHIWGIRRLLQNPYDFGHLELAALKKLHSARQAFGLVAPRSLTPADFLAFKRHLAGEGLHRSPSVHLWLRLVTPANLFDVAEYADIGIDGLVVDLAELAQAIYGSSVSQDLLDADLAQTKGALYQLLAGAFKEKASLPQTVVRGAGTNPEVHQALAALGLNRLVKL